MLTWESMENPKFGITETAKNRAKLMKLWTSEF